MPVVAPVAAFVWVCAVDAATLQNVAGCPKSKSGDASLLGRSLPYFAHVGKT